MPSSRRLRFVLLLVVVLGVAVARGARRNGEHHLEDFTVPEEQAPTAPEQAVVANEGAVFATPQEQVFMTQEEQSLAFLTLEEQAPTPQEQDVVAHEGAVFATPQEQAVMTHEEQSLAFLTPEEQHSQAAQVQLPDQTWDTADRHPWLRLLEQLPEPANGELAPSESGQGGLPDLGSALR
jgi:hypothetical protein